MTCNIQVFFFFYSRFMNFSIRLVVNLCFAIFYSPIPKYGAFLTLFVKLNSVSWRFSILQNILYLKIFKAMKDKKLFGKLEFWKKF